MVATPLTARGMANRNSQQTVQDDTTTANRIVSVLTDQPEGPSAVLNEYFERCKPNPTSHILERARNAVQAVGKACPTSEDKWSLAIRLYFRFLETMLRAEEIRVGHQVRYILRMILRSVNNNV